MDFLTVLKGLQAGAAALEALPGLVKAANDLRGALTTNQQSEIDALLADIKARNDAGFLETDAKLAAASER